MDNEAESLRDAITPKAECGWGCFCDACWASATEAEAQRGRTPWPEPYETTMAVYDTLWSLAFGAHADDAQEAQEAPPGRQAYGGGGER